jgi:exopolysaccharide biosynthesis polyprenyl glycosylphosphotransferase
MIGMIQRALIPFPLISIAFFALIPELRTPVGLGLLATIALLLVLRPIDRRIRTTLQFKTRVLVIGQRTIARKFLDEIERFPERGCTIIGIVENTLSDPTQRSPFLVLGTIDELKTIVAAVKPDLIVVALSDRRGRLPVTELLELQSNGIRVEELADAYERISGKLPIELVTPGQLIASQRLRKSQALKIAQRVLSFTAAVILLALFAPILGIIAIAIKLDSGGSILFRQTRLGKGCRPFQLLKFRTMEPVERPASEWVRDNFERITRVGKWLRRLRFDELPQLVNVIRGDMNLVGPRPHPVGNLQLFRDSIPYYALRSSIRPGITGWAQVRYHYANNLEEETEKMRYDLYYIKHMSIAMDVRIVLKTCGVFLRSLAKSFEDEDVIMTKPHLAVGPTRLRVRVRTERANSARAEETQHQELPVQL